MCSFFVQKSMALDGLMDGCMHGWMDGWMGGRAGLSIAYSNQKMMCLSFTILVNCQFNEKRKQRNASKFVKIQKKIQKKVESGPILKIFGSNCAQGCLPILYQRRSVSFFASRSIWTKEDSEGL